MLLGSCCERARTGGPCAADPPVTPPVPVPFSLRPGLKSSALAQQAWVGTLEPQSALHVAVVSLGSFKL